MNLILGKQTVSILFEKVWFKLINGLQKTVVDRTCTFHRCGFDVNKIPSDSTLTKVANIHKNSNRQSLQ